MWREPIGFWGLLAVIWSGQTYPAEISPCFHLRWKQNQIAVRLTEAASMTTHRTNCRLAQRAVKRVGGRGRGAAFPDEYQPFNVLMLNPHNATCKDICFSSTACGNVSSYLQRNWGWCVFFVLMSSIADMTYTIWYNFICQFLKFLLHHWAAQLRKRGHIHT